mmetsp:Transcript_28595/g.54653  ORF Transcript_28595/g.54653 Transcript_28595/m.54653 type:complete len:229 (+) Transcript_28595:72-758(+)
MRRASERLNVVQMWRRRVRRMTSARTSSLTRSAAASTARVAPASYPPSWSWARPAAAATCFTSCLGCIRECTRAARARGTCWCGRWTTASTRSRLCSWARARSRTPSPNTQRCMQKPTSRESTSTTWTTATSIFPRPVWPRWQPPACQMPSSWWCCATLRSGLCCSTWHPAQTTITTGPRHKGSWRQRRRSAAHTMSVLMAVKRWIELSCGACTSLAYENGYATLRIG